MDVEEMDVLLVKLLMGEFCYFFVFKKVFGMYVLYGVFILYIQFMFNLLIDGIELLMYVC